MKKGSPELKVCRVPSHVFRVSGKHFKAICIGPIGVVIAENVVKATVRKVGGEARKPVDRSIGRDVGIADCRPFEVDHVAIQDDEFGFPGNCTELGFQQVRFRAAAVFV